MENEERLVMDGDVKDKRLEELHRLFAYAERVISNGTLNVFAPLLQTDYRILMYLETHDGAHPSIIAEELNITRPNIAANLGLLARKGYIRRELDEMNRRQIFVYMTEKGKNHIKTVNSKLLILFSSWLDIVGEDEYPHLIKILERSTDPKVITDDLRKFTFDE